LNWANLNDSRAMNLRKVHGALGREGGTLRSIATFG